MAQCHWHFEQSSLSTRAWLTKYLVHPESRRAFRLAFCPEDWIISSMGTVTRVIRPLCRGSSLESMSFSPSLPLGWSEFSHHPCGWDELCNLPSFQGCLVGSCRWLGRLLGGAQGCFLSCSVGFALSSLLPLFSALEASCGALLRALSIYLCFWGFLILQEGFLPPPPAMLVSGKVDLCFLS